MGSPKSPKAPPAPAPPPTELSTDVQQEATALRKKRLTDGGFASTILNRQVNPAEQGGKTLLGQ